MGCAPWCTTATPRTRVHRGQGELQSQHAGAQHDDPPARRDRLADPLGIGEVAQGGHAVRQHVVPGDQLAGKR